MDLQDQLKNLFPDHEVSEVSTDSSKPKGDVPLQQEPLVCKYEKRKGKATTLIEGFLGTEAEFKILAKKLKKEDGLIDWNNSAVCIHNKVRGLLPWPCAFTYYKSKTLKILKTHVTGLTKKEPAKAAK